MKKGIIFALGFVVGAVSTYFATKQMLEKEFKDSLDKEVEEVKSAYRDKYSAKAENSTPEDEKSLNEAKNGQKTASESSNAYKNIIEGLNKGKFSYDSVTGAHDKFEGEQESLEMEMNVEDPRIISYDEFIDNDNNCVEMALTYLSKDDQFIDEVENIFPNPYDYLPKGITGKFGDEDILYVENLKKNRVIEVVLINKSYNEYTGQYEE